MAEKLLKDIVAKECRCCLTSLSFATRDIRAGIDRTRSNKHLIGFVCLMKCFYMFECRRFVHVDGCSLSRIALYRCTWLVLRAQTSSDGAPFVWSKVAQQADQLYCCRPSSRTVRPSTTMARGPKKHMKRLNAPKHWMLDKLGGTWVRWNGSDDSDGRLPAMLLHCHPCSPALVYACVAVGGDYVGVRCW